MGLFDKIKDNAKTISMKAIEATREYEEDYVQPDQTEATPTEAIEPQPAAETPEVAEELQQTMIEPTESPTENETAQPEQPAEDKPEESKPEESKKTSEQDKPDKEPARKSRITEVPKSEHDKKPKVPYTPSYKMNKKSEDSAKSDSKVEVKKTETHTVRTGRVLDVTPNKTVDPAKQAIYARERAALSALASQRRMNGEVALYTTSHMNFKSRVFVNRIEYSGSFGKNVVPIEQVSWVKLRAAGTGVIIESSEGKRIVMVVKPADRLAFADAILKVQAMQPKKGKFKDNKTVRIDQLEQFGEGVDEIEKLAKLYDKGILSQDEFDAKKKQILGI